VRRTQLYLDDDLWNALHARAASSNTTVSKLVRQAVRERYIGDFQERRKAMRAFVGIRRDRDDITDSTEYVRQLRSGDRIERLGRQ
jgi:hypothetical protein